MIGIDLLEISRMERPMRSRRFRERVFTERELDYLSGRGLRSAAGLFCAKEALAKAMGVNICAALKLIEIGHTPEGRPVVLRPEGFEVSITHTNGIAAAAAVKRSSE